MPSRDSSSSTPAAGQMSPGHWADPLWQSWSASLSRNWHGMGVGLDWQQKSLERWVLRQQEWAHRTSAPLTPADWMDLSLQGMRWTAQEWQQAMQDALASALMLRGNLGRDQPDPMAQWWTQQSAQPLQAWMDLWAAAGRRPDR